MGEVADVQLSPGSIVEGVVWEINEVQRDALDKYEEYPTAYTGKDVVVETFEGKLLTAFAYFSSSGIFVSNFEQFIANRLIKLPILLVAVNRRLVKR
jgi:hypothetical protein